MPQLNFNVLARQGPMGVMQGFEQGQQLRNQMLQQKQQEQLAELQIQNALREQRMAGEEEAAYKAAGSDMTRLQQELMSRGLGKQSMAVGAQISKQQTDKMAMLKQQHDLVKTAAAQVMANPEAAAQILTSFGQRTGIDMSGDLAAIQALAGDPNKIKQWAAGIALEADKLLPQFNTRDIGGQVQDRRYNPVTGQIEIIGTTAKTMTPDAIAADARARQQLSISQGQLGVAQAGVALRQQELAQAATRPVFKDGQWITPPTGMQPGEAREVTSPTAAKDAKEALNLIEQASKLIPKATGSYLGNLLDTAAQAVGVGTGGAQATAQLQALEGILVSKMPKMSGPQSDKDVALYRQMAGNIGNPNVPPSIKQEALKTIKEIQMRYAGVPKAAGGVDASNPWLK